jgi:hypothetical protein
MLAAFDVPLSWAELLKRTAKETSADDCLTRRLEAAGTGSAKDD